MIPEPAPPTEPQEPPVVPDEPELGHEDRLRLQGAMEVMAKLKERGILPDGNSPPQGMNVPTSQERFQQGAPPGDLRAALAQRYRQMVASGQPHEVIAQAVMDQMKLGQMMTEQRIGEQQQALQQMLAEEKAADQYFQLRPDLAAQEQRIRQMVSMGVPIQEVLNLAEYTPGPKPQLFVERPGVQGGVGSGRVKNLTDEIVEAQRSGDTSKRNTLIREYVALKGRR